MSNMSAAGNSFPPPDHEPPAMVGVGGSAGSIGPLQQFFGAMPVDTGMIFVVILHLSPEHESMLAETIQRHTAMPVLKAVDGVKVEPNVIYVIPPARHLSSTDGELRLTPLEHQRGRRGAVDFFFRTLAASHGRQSVAVVLSGADGDGAIGIKRIKELGGLTIAQDPDEAEHPGMPRAAIATGMVDWVLGVRDMPARLAAFVASRARLRLPAEEGPHPAQKPAPSAGEHEVALREVLAYVQTRTARDFSYYKRATILRRIARRMRINGVDELSEYLAYLRTHAGEAGALLQDLLISVTNFFRDPEAFAALAALVPELFQGKGGSDTVRVWVAACATGEEAYSVAMLLFEHARTLEAPPQIQVFATDLDQEVIREARDGLYPESIATDVSEERLRRFFIREHRGYRVRREVREVVLFALHDVLKDSPFSRLDLVTCRNLLIYLNREAQQRAVAIFHFALLPGGRLFLGSSETVDEGSVLFAATDKKARLYQQRPGPRQPLPLPVGPGTLARALEMRERVRERPTLPPRSLLESVPFATPPLAGEPSWSELHYRLIERVSPPSVLVNAAHEIVHLSESAGRFLQFAGGEPTRDLLRAVHPALRLDLRAALFTAAQTRAPASAFRIPFAAGETSDLVDLRVSPADDLAADFLLVVFEAHPSAEPVPALPPRTAEDDLVSRRLEHELESTKGQLRDTIEQSSASTEELKASNEELQAMNEELRSATEELVTSREELQSINEELTTVNQELKGKVEQLAQANNDLHNLMSATAIATVFLDRNLRIVRYTPSAIALFNFIPGDVGRPLTDLARQLDYPEFVADAAATLEHLAIVQREIRSGDRWYLSRGLPYRTEEDRIAGVVFSFLDITARKQAEESLRESEERFRAIVNQAAAGVSAADMTGRLTLVNARLCELTGLGETELLGQLLQDLPHPDDRADYERRMARLTAEGESFTIEHRYVRADGTESWLSSAVTAIRDGNGTPQSVAAIVLDITERRQAELALRAQTEEMETLVDAVPAFVWTCLDQQCRVIVGNRAANALTGTAPATNVSQSSVAAGEAVYLRQLKPDGTEYRPDELPMQRAIATGQPVREALLDFRFPDGRSVQALGNAVPLLDEHGRPRGAIAAFVDITALKRAEAELIEARRLADAANASKDRFLAVLSHELRTPLTPVLMAVSALEHDPDLRPEIREDLTMMKRNIELETKLIDDLLDLNRIISGKLELRVEPVDLHETVRHVCGICASQIHHQRVRLETKLPSGTALIAGDSARLHQVIWNVLKNAIKFTPEGGTIRVATQRVAGARWELRVQDSGIGISQEALPRIFDAFEQGDIAVTKQFGGLGLGLAICKALVELHQGTIHAESDGPGAGATFIIELPGKETGALLQTPRPSEDGSVSPPRLRLLLVDDHADTVHILSRHLRAAGFAVSAASDVASAVAAAGREEFDLLVCDMGLPDGDGIDVLRRIHALRPMPAIAMSGFGMDEDRRASLEAGFGEHLVKPVEVTHLIAAIRRVAGLRE